MVSNKHILVVDHEPVDRKMLSELLEGINCSVDTAGDGEEAVRTASKSNYDLVITCLSLPLFSGAEVLAAIKRIRPDTPVIVVTGYAALDAAIEAMKLGAYDCITKPFNIDRIEVVIERALERSRLIDENNSLREQLRERHGSQGALRSPRLLGSLEDMERNHIEKVLTACKWHQTKAADILQIDRKTLRNKIRQFGFDKPAATPDSVQLLQEDQ